MYVNLLGARMTSIDQGVHESHFELDFVNSSQAASTSSTKQGKRVRPRYTGWTFQLIFSADITTLNGMCASRTRKRDPSGKAKATAWAHQISHVYKARHCYFGWSLLLYVRNFWQSPGGCFYFYSIACHCVHLFRPENAVTLPPCNTGTLLPGLQSRVVCQATNTTKITEGKTRIRTTDGLRCVFWGASALLMRLARSISRRERYDGVPWMMP